MKLRKNGPDEKAFEWIGHRLRRKARDRRQENIKNFNAFKYGKLEGKIGDYMLISNVDAVDPDTVEGCDVAKIMELYESAENEEPYRAVVQWYSRPQQLPKKFSSHKMPFPQFDSNYEVVEDKRNFDNDVNIESFFSKCQVFQAMPDEDPKEVINSYSYDSGPVYVVRFQFWASKGKQRIEILPMSLEEVSQEMEVDSECEIINSYGNRNRKSSTVKSTSHHNQEGELSDPDEDGLSVDSEVVLNSGEPRLRYILLSDGEKTSTRKALRSVKSGRTKLTSVSELEDKSKSPSTPKTTKKKYDCTKNLSYKESSPKIDQKNLKNVTSKLSLKKSDFANEEMQLKTASGEHLKDKDISGLLEEESDQSSDIDSVSEDEKIGFTKILSYESLMENNHPNLLLKLRRIPTRTTAGRMGNGKHATSSPSSTPCDSSNVSVDKSVVLSTPTRRAKKRTCKGNLAVDMELPKCQSPGTQSEIAIPPKTPSQKRTPATPKSTGSIKSLSARKRLQLLTDVGQGVVGMVERGRSAGPIVAPSSPLEEARARLHVSSVPNCLPCREEEFASIYSFVEDKILDGAGGCMYICGVPGTGKTATVREVVRQLQEASSRGEIPAFEYGEVNGMRVTEPRRAYSEVLRVLTGRAGVVPEEARELLDQRFSRPAPRRLPTLLLIDELDLLWTRRQDVVYNLMDWPNRDQSRLVVITIANTMDLPERILMGRVSSRLGLTRLTFHPYSFQQLQEIVMSRMKGLKAFDPDAVQLVARKVAAVSGDARRALDICRRATECAESELAIEKTNTSQSPIRRKLPKVAQNIVVTMRHVDQAVSEMISSSKAKAIQSCSRLEKLFLQAVAAEVERTGVEEAVFERVHAVVGTLSTYNGFRRPTVSESLSVCWRLGSLRLLLTEATSRADILQRVMLNVDVDSVHYALKIQNQ